MNPALGVYDLRKAEVYGNRGTVYIMIWMTAVCTVPASRLPAKSRASWCAGRSRGNQAEDNSDSTMLAMPTVQLLLISSTEPTWGILRIPKMHYYRLVSTSQRHHPMHRHTAETIETTHYRCISNWTDILYCRYHTVDTSH